MHRYASMVKLISLPHLKISILTTSQHRSTSPSSTEIPLAFPEIPLSGEREQTCGCQEPNTTHKWIYFGQEWTFQSRSTDMAEKGKLPEIVDPSGSCCVWQERWCIWQQRKTDTLSLHFYLAETTRVAHRERDRRDLRANFLGRAFTQQSSWKFRSFYQCKLTCLIPNGQEEGSYWERIY